MNSFRVMNTRFRILKGGKIGLAFSIALIGGMLTLGSTKANATDYFTDVNTTLGTTDNLTGFFDVTSAQTATNAGTTSVTITGTSVSDSVVFNPTAWATSSYTTVTFNGNIDDDIPLDGTTDYSTYILNTSNSALPALTLTFDTAANASSISKVNHLTVYSAPTSGPVNVFSNTSYALTQTLTAPYIANLVFTGSNTVSGYTDIENGNIQLNGGVTFTGPVTAGSVNVNTTNTVTFNDTVNLSPGTTDELKFIVDGNIILNSNLTGNITSGGDNLGTVTLSGDGTGKAQSIIGNIGSSTSLDLGILNIGSDTVSANYSKTTINGDVFANSTVLNNGTTNSSELILASGKNITSTITTADNGKGILTLFGGTQTVTGQVGTGGVGGLSLAEVNAGANGATSTFTNDVFATNLDVEGTGTVNLGGDFTGTALRYNDNGIVNLADGKNINSSITSDAPNQGTLNLVGTSTVTGQVGDATNNLKEINANGIAGKTVTFANNVYATNTNIGAGTVDIKGNLTGAVNSTSPGVGTLTTTGIIDQIITGTVGNIGNLNISNIGHSTTVAGNVNAVNTKIDSTLIMTDGSNITSTITGAGNLTLDGSSTVTGTVGNTTTSLGNINANGIAGETVTFANDVYATNIENTGTGATTFQANVVATNVNVNVNAGTSTFQDNLTAATTTISTGTGNFNTVSGATTSDLRFTDNGTANLNNGLTGNVTTTADNKGTLNLVGSSNQTVTGPVGASGASLAEVNAGANGSTSTFANDVYATNTNIGSGRVDFNTVSGITNTNIIFTDNGTANLLNGLTGNIDFAGKDATVNVSDGKGILGSVQTLASNNTGIINYQGDGTISGNIGSSSHGIKELNINTANQQNSGGPGLVIGYTALARELYADVVNLRNNATLTLKDNVNLINTGSDNILITVDNTNTGTLTFEGTSNITGEVGQSNKVLNTINAGATGKTVTFDDMVYASTLKYSDNGKVVLNGDNSSNTSSEGMIGTVNFDNKAGTLAIGDDVNLTVGAGGTQFINGNDAILEFDGSSIITGILGGNTAGNSTFEEIYAGADNKTVTFKNDVYVKESTFHVSGEGTVNFEGNLTGDLIYDADGVVNVSDGKNIIVSSSPVAVTTATTDTGSLNFLGTTLLATDIGTSSERLKNVTFGSAGSAANTYTQNLDKDIYAQNTYIGNGTNKTILEMKDDVKFGGSLTVRANSALDVNTRDLTVTDNLTLAANSLTGFKIYTSDITATGSSTGVPSGSITTDTLTIDNNAIIKVNYVGTLYGAGSYTLISANSISGTYLGTEANGKVSDNSIIDSIIKVDGNNLILFADRTGGGKYGVEDLYIVKSGIGEHYSNGASEALAGYAYDTLVREGALGNIVTKIEELDGGLYLSSEKKAQMVEIQKLLAPVANNSSVQSSLTASTLVSSTIKDRMSDIRFSSSTDFIPYGYSGYSSGTYTLNNSLWIKAMGSKATQSKVQDYDGYESTTLGFVAGLDRTLRNGATIGLALAHANTKIDQTDFRRGDSSDTQSIQLSTYGSMDFGDTYVDGILSYAKHSTDSIRTANSGKLSSSSDADQISAKVEVGHRIYFEDLATLTPFTSLEYGNLNQKGYTEKGTSYQNDALKVDSVKVNKGTLGVGAKLSTNLNIGDTVIVPEFKLAAYNAFGDTNADIKAQYVGGGSQFVTPTQDLNKTMFNAGLGVKTTLSESTSVMIGVDYDRSKDGNFEGYSGNVSFRLNF